MGTKRKRAKEKQRNAIICPKQETPFNHLKVKVEKNTTTHKDNAPQSSVSGVGWFFAADEAAMPKHTPVCSREDHFQKGKAYGNKFLNIKKR